MYQERYQGGAEGDEGINRSQHTAWSGQLVFTDRRREREGGEKATALLVVVLVLYYV
jgi:hypothetical protein